VDGPLTNEVPATQHEQERERKAEVALPAFGLGIRLGRGVRLGHRRLTTGGVLRAGRAFGLGGLGAFGGLGSFVTHRSPVFEFGWRARGRAESTASGPAALRGLEGDLRGRRVASR